MTDREQDSEGVIESEATWATASDAPDDREGDEFRFGTGDAQVGATPAVTGEDRQRWEDEATSTAEGVGDRGPDDDGDESEARSDPAGDDAAVHTGERRPPEASDPTEQGAFAIPNYTQDLLNFEFVLEEESTYLPQDVDGAGMIRVDEETFVAIARVKPRSWSIHTAEKKSQIAEIYQSAFLSTIDFPIQIVSYPTRFDISDHVDNLQGIVENDRGHADDSRLITLGRELYPRWLDEFITQNDMKQRQFYVVVTVSAEKITQLQGGPQGMLEKAGERFPPLQPLVAFFGTGQDREVTRKQCVRELNSRLRRVEGGLQRLDVTVERLRDRNEVLSVLYHYYNNRRPTNPDFDVGTTRTVAAEDDQGGRANE